MCLTGGRVKSAGRLRVDSSTSPRPRKSAKSPRPASHKSDSTNYSVAQYKLKEDNTKVQMTPYGLRRVRNYERPTYGRLNVLVCFFSCFLHLSGKGGELILFLLFSGSLFRPFTCI